MIYCTSDLHGISLDELKELLSKANFCDDDFLFVLGDVIDRGEHGVELLLWMIEQANIELILGNHEAMLMSCTFLFDEITDESIDNLREERLGLFSNWMANGGGSTLNELYKLSKESPDTLNDLLDFLSDLPLFETITVGDKDFILTHSGFGSFDPNKKISEYSSDDLLWNRPVPSDRYFDDIITVFGHTPTCYLDEGNKGKIIKTDTWIDIDVGTASGFPPCLLRLDDMEEFYL